MTAKMLPYLAFARKIFLQMTIQRISALFLGLSLFIVASNGQVPAVKTSSNSVADAASRFLPLSSVKEGMKGVARTVFQGSKPEEFNVEIMGVIPGGIGPKQDLIVGRISGGKADRTGVFAGMSGSPVYIDGKLLGAISYSFPFAKEPICGITPIEQMIAIFEQRSGSKSGQTEPRSFSFAELASTKLDLFGSRPTNAVGSSVLSSTNSAMASVAGQSFRPIGTPLSFSGFSQAALDLFASQLIQAGLIPVSAAGGSARITPLKAADETTLLGGTSVSMQLTRGDYSLAASGTVTFRDGNKIYAFGHPFISLGSTDLPMSESDVVTVVPNINNSFKLAVPGSMVGAMTQDRATGVYGTLGQAPTMIPVRINVETSRGAKDTINFEVARDDFLTPLLLNIALFNSLVAQERSLGETTVQIKGQINLAAHESIKIDRRFSGGQANQSAAGSVAVPVNVLLRSRFDDLQIKGIEVNVVSSDGSKTAQLERVSVDRTQYKAGETIEVNAIARTLGGRVFVQKIPVKIPEDTPAGTFSIAVGDGSAIQQGASIQQFAPRNLSELVGTINRLKLSDRLYIQMFRTSTGAIIGASEMPNLPPSVLATLNNDRTAGGVKPAVQTVVTESEIAPADFIISGQQTLLIEIVN